MITRNPPAPATLPRLVRDGVAAYRQDQFWQWYGLLNRSERNALYIEALCAGPAPRPLVSGTRTPEDIVFAYVARLSEEAIP